jgi:two-component system, OmpR family, sensor kinase
MEHPPQVFADIGLCELLLENFENAVSYTPKDGSISMRAIPENDRVAVRVSDTGSGIRPEDVPHLFDRFYRKYRSHSDSNSDSGLGLAIAKRILDLHGSGLEVTSSVNAGTTFAFTLPIYETRS